MESRKRWIRAGIAPRGRILVDDGAARALTEERRSLLPAGVLSVEGRFEPADLVQIVTTDGRTLGTGLTRYSAADINRIRGERSERILEILGYDSGHEIVHCDYLVLE